MKKRKFQVKKPVEVKIKVEKPDVEVKTDLDPTVQSIIYLWKYYRINNQNPTLLHFLDWAVDHYGK